MTGRELLTRLMRNNPRFREAMLEMEQNALLLHQAAAQGTGCPTLIVCGTDHGGVVGARQGRCGCNALIWLSPPTQELVDRTPDQVFPLCPSCAEKALCGVSHA